MPHTAGDRVTVRGERWIVEDATEFGDATLLNLLSAGAHGAQRRCRLLTPFDTPVLSERTPRIRAVTRRRWMHHLQSQVAHMRAFGALRAPQQAAIDILPFQLEPALALVRGHGSRFLLADEVGLGKTIQAGLMLAELLQRGWCDRALIVTPAGLRQQWIEELLHRFGIEAALIDASSLAARARALPYGVNPWAAEPVAIASIDFVKQPEVLRGLASQSWDALIVDEAHQATLASMRYAAVSALAKRARHVVLITATPHAGDERAYRALCGIGAISSDDPILRFRRTRNDAGVRRSRRAHLLPVRPSPACAEMHRLLEGYLKQLWAIGRSKNKHDVQLVAMVLAKRAFSSARSLATSLERRMAALTGDIEPSSQAALPLTLEEDFSDEPPMPVARAFEHGDEEREAVQRIIGAARRTTHEEPKMRVLRRIARRVSEPLIIFTEYRDTLDAICDQLVGIRTITTLHGGQTPLERRESLLAFSTGAANVMIATDAGSEGLNLQENCRLVINLELPWNPIRLEQRIGRVDRIGQARRVHAINLLAEGTAERTVLAGILRRIDRIRMSEIEIASCVINGFEPPAQAPPVEACTSMVDLTAEARAESERIHKARQFSRARTTLADETVPVTVVRSPGASLIPFFRIRVVTGAGRLIEDTLVPVRVPIDAVQNRLSPKAARALAEASVARFGALAAHHARQHANVQSLAAARDSRHWIARAMRRERAIAECLTADGPAPVQAGLFDNRELKEMCAQEDRRDRIRRESDARADLLQADSRALLAHDPELAMLLILCSPV